MRRAPPGFRRGPFKACKRALLHPLLFYEALWLVHVDLGDHVCVEKCKDDVHLLNLMIMVGCKGKTDSKRCIPKGWCEDGRLVHFLHVSSGHEPGLILGDGAKPIPLKLKLS